MIWQINVKTDQSMRVWKRNSRKLKNYMKKTLYESIEHRIVSACDVTGQEFSRYSVMDNEWNTLRKPFHGKKRIYEYNVVRGEHVTARENKTTCGDNTKPTVVC